MRQIKLFALCILMFLSGYCFAQSKVVISQVYGGAGCLEPAGCSSYKNDYIELFNAGNAAQHLSGWSVQYSSASATTYVVTALTNFTLQPGQYYLVALPSSVTGINALPTPDASGSFSMLASSGKVALVSGTTPLSGSCPTGASVIDFVGWGSTANCSEGNKAPSHSTTTALLRAGNGCTDANNNRTDFTAGSASPRNSSTAVAPCSTLPVSFIDFKAQYNEATRSVSINWSTAQEQNAKEFLVERSTQGSNWSLVATVNAVGNSTATTYYQAKDLHPQPGTNLYRIKQVDRDGRFQYTGIIGSKTTGDSKSWLSVFPNPGRGQVLINASVNGGAKVEISITDMTGKQVWKQQRIVNAITPLGLDVSELGKGTYFIRVLADGYNKTEKLVLY